MWRFRCRMIHAFSPAGFSLTHHHSENHLKIVENGDPILNAEDFYSALVVAQGNCLERTDETWGFR